MSATQSFIDRNPVLNVGLRTLLATLGAYGVASLGAAAFSVGLPMVRLDAAIIALMAGFLLQMLGVLWVFAAANVWRALAGLALPALVFALWLAAVKGVGV